MTNFSLTMQDFEKLGPSWWFCQLEYGHVNVERDAPRLWEVRIFWKNGYIRQSHRSRKACLDAIPKLMRAFE